MRLFSLVKLQKLYYALAKQHGVSFALSLAIIVLMLLHAGNVLPFAFIHKLENFSYDRRLNLLKPNTVDSRIVVVDIDEKSLAEQGRWPWGRDKIAALVNQLFDSYQINTLGFDVVFAEKDESSGLKNLEWIQQQYLKEDAGFADALKLVKPKLDYDQIFADSLKNRKVVLGYYFQIYGDINHVGQLPPAIFAVEGFDNQTIAFTEASGYGANLAILQKNALSAGHFNPEPDADGITRKISTLIKYKGSYYDALAIAVARAYLQSPQMEVTFATVGADENYVGVAAIKMADKRIPVGADAATLIPYRGEQGSFNYVSASDVLNNKVSSEILKNKIVLVGTTAPGLMDLRATPVQSNYPGVEVHANIISGILDNNIKERPAFTNGVEFLLLLLAGLLLAFTLPRLNQLKATLLTLTLLAAVSGINFVAWQYANLVLPIASLLLMISLIYLVNMSYGFFVESRGKRQLTGLFGQYVPPELVKKMAKNPEEINLKGESREMTVLFSDIRGFTGISEGLDPNQLSQMMNEFLTPMTQIIHNNRGTIDKYMGDAIMAFWGAPLRDKNHAQNALNAAIQMNASIKVINEKFAKKGWPAIQMGYGLNTGSMVVGNMGSSFRMAYTVMGDSVNLGSRIEGLSKYYGADIVVSEFVKAQTPDIIYRELDIVRVKGKDQPVTIYQPLGTSEQVSKETLNELELYQEAILHYRNQDWDLAMKLLKNLQKTAPNPLYALYIARIKQFMQSPPGKNWNGVFTYESK
ncbi:MAG: adenylate/guanylate cyclase domain-containing protein [Methylotenera sp.]